MFQLVHLLLRSPISSKFAFPSFYLLVMVAVVLIPLRALSLEVRQDNPSPPIGMADDDGDTGRKTPRRILFIGNSFTEYGPIPDLLKQLAIDSGIHDVDIQRRTLLGKSLTHHREDRATDGAPKRIEEVWDVVVLQDYSTRPTDSGDAKTFYNEVSWFHERIKSVNAKTQIYLFETWAWRKDKDIYPGLFADPTQMQAQVRHHYNFVAKHYVPENTQYPDTPPIKVTPVGDVWEKGIRDGILLHDPDGHHASPLGKYLIALVFYATIFEKPVTGFQPLLGVKTEDATRLQKLTDAHMGY